MKFRFGKVGESLSVLCIDRYIRPLPLLLFPKQSVSEIPGRLMPIIRSIQGTRQPEVTLDTDIQALL